MQHPWPFTPLVLTALLIAGCSSKFATDLQSADDACAAQHPTTKAALAACLDAGERPVWAAEQPVSLDLYDGFARGRAELAAARDAGTLDDAQYHKRLNALAAGYRARIAERRRAEEAAGARPTAPTTAAPAAAGQPAPAAAPQ